MGPIRIAVLSDDRLFCEGVLRIVSAEHAFAALGYQQQPSLPFAFRAQPNVLIVDSRLEGAIAFAASLQADGGPAVLFVAVPDDPDWAARALSAGASGLLPRATCPDELVKAISAVHEGRAWIPRQLMHAWVRRVAPARRAGNTGPDRSLSRREREIFEHAATGLGNKELAVRLAISEATVKVHLTHIFKKLGLRGRGELAAAFYGILPSTAGTIAMSSFPTAVESRGRRRAHGARLEIADVNCV